MKPPQSPPSAGKVGEPCDHEWVFQDDSFDHEFGCERVHYMRCEKCDATKDCEDDSPDIDFP